MPISPLRMFLKSHNQIRQTPCCTFLTTSITQVFLMVTLMTRKKFETGWKLVKLFWNWSLIKSKPANIKLQRITVNPQKRVAGLILPLGIQMRVLLEFSPNLGIFAYCFLSFLWVLSECGSYSRVGLFRGFTVYSHETIIRNNYWLSTT